MQQTNPHTILSIGPIYETIKLADNTRAVWTVSFMFSYIMRETIKELLKEVEEKAFIVPHINDAFKAYLDDGQRAGLFHDRLILKGVSADVVDRAFNEAIKNLSKKVWETFDSTKFNTFTKYTVNENDLKEYITNYFQSYIATVDMGTDSNPILELSKYVDAVEYEPRLAPFEEKEFMHYFLRLANLSELQDIAFLEDAQNVVKDRCFKSLAEISAYELIKAKKKEWKKEHLCLKIEDLSLLEESIKDPNSETEEILTLLKGEHKKDFKPYHKYVAIVQADGDGFGKYLESIGGDEIKLRAFSGDMFKFADSARAIIELEGGSVVMAGGDDLLFFSPVVNGKENIFTLINAIDTAFRGIFSDTRLSMSYGVSISYHKFPLQEGLDKAYNALIYQAKKTKWVDQYLIQNTVSSPREKNAIHINIRKHSGQSYAMNLPKDTRLYALFMELLTKELDTNDDLWLPHSLQHAISNAHLIIDSIPAQRIEPFFKNQFNEDVHNTNHKDALALVQDILKHLKNSDECCHQLADGASIKTPTSVLISMLSMIKLLRGDE